jgi:hypothetical protein
MIDPAFSDCARSGTTRERESLTSGPRRAHGWPSSVIVALLAAQCLGVGACGDRRIVFCDPALPEAIGGCGLAGIGGASGGGPGTAGGSSGRGGAGGSLILGGSGGGGGGAGTTAGSGGTGAPQPDPSTSDDAGSDAGDSADASVTP